MAEIPQIKGNQQNIDFIARSFEKGMLSHAYIISGENGSGKKAFAEYIAAAVLCDNMNDKDEDPNQASWAAFMGTAEKKQKVFAPCGHCPSCIKAASRNHPDIIHVKHEKATVLSVAEIREQVVDDISIKPYYGPYKIYIIDDANLMNENGQNALLKTIEEPLSYGLVMLLTDNADGFLQTIKSRCIRIAMDPIPKEERAAALLDENGEQAAEILEGLKGMNALQISKRSKELEDMDKQQVTDIFRLWFRDVLVYKSTKEEDRIIFNSKLNIIKQMADNTPYEGINNIIDAVNEAKSRLDTSVKAEAAYENLLLSIRRELRHK